jgi:hypothetical protein
MPDWWTPNGAGFGKSNGKFDSGQGKWKITKNHDGWWDVQFKFETGTFFSSVELNGGFFTTKDLGGEKPPYSLWFYIGDPDSGPLMIFEQVVANP